MPFPTEFPVDAAKAIGNAVLARSFTLALLEPAYDLQGYAEYMLIGGGGEPFPKPVVGDLGPDPDDAHVARALLAEAENHEPGRFGVGVVGVGALPWASILKLVIGLIGLLGDEKPTLGESDPIEPKPYVQPDN